MKRLLTTLIFLASPCAFAYSADECRNLLKEGLEEQLRQDGGQAPNCTVSIIQFDKASQILTYEATCRDGSTIVLEIPENTYACGAD